MHSSKGASDNRAGRRAEALLAIDEMIGHLLDEVTTMVSLRTVALMNR